MTADRKDEGYIIEFQAHGATVKVSVFDPATLAEVSLVGPSSAGHEALERAAIAKLAYVQRRRKEKSGASDASTDFEKKKPGIVV